MWVCVWLFHRQTNKSNNYIIHNSFGWVWFGLSDWVWFGYSTDKQTNNNYLILINLLCEFVFGYSTDEQTN